MEKIISIKEGDFKSKGSYSELSGYIVKTDKSEYRFGISNDQNCCEHWGHLTSEDDLDMFVGAELTDVSVVDEALKTTELKLKGEVNLFRYMDSCMFVNINTNIGTLQLVAYNDHNGYYGHSVVLEKDEVVIDDGYL
jgi:hypothetical protein